MRSDSLISSFLFPLHLSYSCNHCFEPLIQLSARCSPTSPRLPSIKHADVSGASIPLKGSPNANTLACLSESVWGVSRCAAHTRFLRVIYCVTKSRAALKAVKATITHCKQNVFPQCVMAVEQWEGSQSTGIGSVLWCRACQSHTFKRCLKSLGKCLPNIILHVP